jgi:hypothetical protein
MRYVYHLPTLYAYSPQSDLEARDKSGSGFLGRPTDPSFKPINIGLHFHFVELYAILIPLRAR